MRGSSLVWSVKPCSHVNIFVRVKRQEWVLWQQMMMFILNICIVKNGAAKIKEKHQRWCSVWMDHKHQFGSPRLFWKHYRLQIPSLLKQNDWNSFKKFKLCNRSDVTKLCDLYLCAIVSVLLTIWIHAARSSFTTTTNSMATANITLLDFVLISSYNYVTTWSSILTDSCIYCLLPVLCQMYVNSVIKVNETREKAATDTEKQVTILTEAITVD